MYPISHFSNSFASSPWEMQCLEGCPTTIVSDKEYSELSFFVPIRRKFGLCNAITWPIEKGGKKKKKLS
jgi:hypothetical protein